MRSFFIFKVWSASTIIDCLKFILPYWNAGWYFPPQIHAIPSSAQLPYIWVWPIFYNAHGITIIFGYLRKKLGNNRICTILNEIQKLFKKLTFYSRVVYQFSHWKLKNRKSHKIMWPEMLQKYTGEKWWYIKRFFWNNAIVKTFLYHGSMKW